ncbi:MAG: sterol desaturase family protein [Actinomycetota bacterium]|nr:sterol desaturase family protein [Actinomycetota bacterium]
MTALLAGMVAFVLMEPVTYAAHRWVMHGIGWFLHRSHHRIRRPRGTLAAQVEANDWFPVMFAAATIAAMAVATSRPGAHLLLPIGIGVTAYGAAYATVHDLYIHGRFVRAPVVAPLERLRAAHALHHRFGGEPYGMLCPIVPRDLRERAGAAPGPSNLVAGEDTGGNPMPPSSMSVPVAQAPQGISARPTTASLRVRGTLTRVEKTS